MIAIRESEQLNLGHPYRKTWEVQILPFRPFQNLPGWKPAAGRCWRTATNSHDRSNGRIGFLCVRVNFARVAQFIERGASNAEDEGEIPPASTIARWCQSSMAAC